MGTVLCDRDDRGREERGGAGKVGWAGSGERFGGASWVASGREGKGKNWRLTALLGLSKLPTRAGLLKDTLSRNSLKLSPSFIKELYNVLEVIFDPLTLGTAVAPIFEKLLSEASYASYLPLLRSALLSQLSQVYSTLRIDNLLGLVAPPRDESVQASHLYDENQVEAFVLGFARRGELNIIVDHAAGSITFVDDAFEPSGSTSPHGRLLFSLRMETK